MKVCSLSFCALAVPSLGLCNFIWQPSEAPTGLTGSFSASLKSMKKAGSEHFEHKPLSV